MAGIFPQRVRKEYLKIPQDVRDSIVEFYHDNSRMCSGTKECLMKKVPGSESIALQKRILLYDLKDLYKNWKELNKDKFEFLCGFSLFASLRPKECVIAGSPGTHKICVCQIHENCKLKLNALRKGLDYRDVMEECVCSVANRDCMEHNCGDCKSKDEIREILEELCDKGTDHNFSFYNWLTGSGKSSTVSESSSSQTSIELLTQTYDTFMEKLVEDFWELTKHHYISENQKSYFHYIKERCDSDTAIILMDFAEKYAFICQDSTQGFYYNNNSAVVHPTVVYYKKPNSNILEVSSFCIISNCSKQTAFTVNAFQEVFLNEIKQTLPWVKKIIYFTDGSPTQYKNK